MEKSKWEVNTVMMGIHGDSSKIQYEAKYLNIAQKFDLMQKQ